MSQSSRAAEATARSGFDLYSQVQRLARPGAVGEAQFGSGGLTFPAAAETLLGLFALTEPMVFPDPNDPQSPDVPYSPHAQALWFNAGANVYGGADYSRDETLYHPTALRQDGAAVGQPPLAVGQRCYAWFNRQSGRWEVLCAPPTWCRFEMTEGLTCGLSATARAYTFDAAGTQVDDQPPAQSIVVYDGQSQFSKMPTVSGDAGALGIAQFMPDRNRWEIVAMQTPGDFWGTLEDTLRRGDAARLVRALEGGVLGGYSVFGSNHGPTLNAYNPSCRSTGPDYWFSGRAGDRVFCRWDIRQAQYWILAVEPNDQDWQPWDLVVRTSLSIDFNAHTFDHHFYTRQIKLPPWLTVGDEVEH